MITTAGCWLAKAIARQAGRKALHNEDTEFSEARAKLNQGNWFAAWLVAYKGTLLEGLEVWLVVVAFSLHSKAWLSNSMAGWSHCWPCSRLACPCARRCAGFRKTPSSMSLAA